MISLKETSLLIKQKALQLGFHLIGFAPAEPPEKSSFLDEWLAMGYAADMAYLHRNSADRKNLRNRFPWAESLICVAFRYPQDRPGDGLAPHIARYAQGDDYHLVLDRPLRDLESYVHEISVERIGRNPRTWRYIDTGPVLEKAYARAAGIGWMGKNTLILNERLGSYLLLGQIITDLTIPPDDPAAERCGSCTRCLDACPTGAFVAPYVLDSSRCISYHTIESKKKIPHTIAQKLPPNLFGCDICQEVCPWNQQEPPHPAEPDLLTASFLTRPNYNALRITDLVEMEPGRFQMEFRKSPLKRPGLAKIRATAKIISDPASTKEPAEEKTQPESPSPTPRSSMRQNIPSA